MLPAHHAAQGSEAIHISRDSAALQFSAEKHTDND